MRNLVRALAVCVFAVTSTIVSGQVAETVSIDENGNGTDSFFGSLSSGVGVEPVSGMSTLFYNLPEIPTSGDVEVFEGGNSTTPSDLLRFDQSTSRVYVFSLAEPNPTLADVGLPTT